MSTPLNDISKYQNAFGGACPSGQVLRGEALKCALDIRKFEIDLYWRRATYFWTLIAAAFGGYLALASAAIVRPGLVFLVSCLGVVLSIAWYLVNRGSKFWQENWECHVDTLEDAIMGPLYKTTICRDKFSFWKFWSGYPYSVSKINQLVSLFVAIIWLGLAVQAFPHRVVPICLDRYLGLGGVTALFIVLLFWKGRTRPETQPREICFSKSDLA